MRGNRGPTTRSTALRFFRRHLTGQKNTTTSESFCKLGIRSGLQKAMNTLGMSDPTPIQARGIPSCLTKPRVALAAETGSGKTLSYLLPTLETLKRVEEAKGRALPCRPRAIIVAPSRELAIQIADDAKTLNKNAGDDSHFRSLALIGGTTKQRQARTLKNGGIDLIVGTPGRVQYHRDAGHLFTSQLEVLVLDEADTLLIGGFEHELKCVLDSVRGISETDGDDDAEDGDEETTTTHDDPDNECRVILAGASFDKDVHDAIRASLGHSFEWVHTPRLHSLPPTAEQVDVVVAERGEKHGHLVSEIRQRIGVDDSENDAKTTSVLVFCNSIASCRSTEHALREAGIDSLGLHGGIPPRMRDVNYKRFASRNASVLVCTDLAARGLHLPHVGCVVNFDAPRDSYEFIHRGGRTARAGREGEVVSIVHGRERQRLNILRNAAQTGDFLGLKATQEAMASRGQRRRQDKEGGASIASKKRKQKKMEARRRRRGAPGEGDGRHVLSAEDRTARLPRDLQRRIRKL